MLALLLPLYLYIQESITNIKNEEFVKIKKEASDIKLSICIVKNIQTAVKYIENYKIVFLDKNDKVVYSNTLHINPKYYPYDEKIDDDKVYVKKYLEQTRNGATKFLVIKDIDYSDLIIKVTLLGVYILIFLILSSGTLLHISTKTLTQTNRYLTQFFNDAMHEIKTPLGIIQLNLDMLSMTIKESNLPILNRTQAAVKTLSSVYDDIEYFIKHDKVDFQKEEINLSKFLQDRIEYFEVLAKIKKIKLNTDIENSLFYSFNRIELQRVIDNNLSNAIKYSPAKTNIHISLKRDTNFITLSFKDEGYGIDDTAKIFKRYHRGDEIKGGFGIGLSIVHKICKKYQILIEVESKKGEGSTFIYRLPVDT